MSTNTCYVSEQWLRSHIYERGKDGPDEIVFRSHHSVRLAEARAILQHQWVHSPDEFLDLESGRDHAGEGVASSSVGCSAVAGVPGLCEKV
jgi:hypothetical protein